MYRLSPPYAFHIIRALPHDSTRADRRENLCRKKAQNRRNTLRIARFCNAFVGQIGRQDVRGELCGDALIINISHSPVKPGVLALAFSGRSG